jgi:voltage-gated potassium channel
MGPIALRAWQVLEENHAGDRLNTVVDRSLLWLIVLNVAASIVATVPEASASFSGGLDRFERVSTLVFAAEYLARVWAAPVDPRYHGAVRGRLRYVLTPMALVDLCAVLPFSLVMLGADPRLEPAARVFRLCRLAKLARYFPALRLVADVARSRGDELRVTLGALLLLLVGASSLMYYAEHAAQPERFASIPATMWWAVATVTTVGYGDVVPVTPLGRLLGAAVAVLGIAFFAFPTAILGSGFIDAFGRRREAPCCPHCNRPLDGSSSPAGAIPAGRRGASRLVTRNRPRPASPSSPLTERRRRDDLGMEAGTDAGTQPGPSA